MPAILHSQAELLAPLPLRKLALTTCMESKSRCSLSVNDISDLKTVIGDPMLQFWTLIVMNFLHRLSRTNDVPLTI